MLTLTVYNVSLTANHTEFCSKLIITSTDWRKAVRSLAKLISPQKKIKKHGGTFNARFN